MVELLWQGGVDLFPYPTLLQVREGDIDRFPVGRVVSQRRFTTAGMGDSEGCVEDFPAVGKRSLHFGRLWR